MASDTRFKPGQSGNPGGRPKGLADVTELARQHTEEAIQTLANVMRRGSPAAKVAAANAILNRAWGEPPKTVTVNDSSDIRELPRAVLLAIAGLSETNEPDDSNNVH
jgi:Family of unknown function (DUF5681)